MFDMLCSRVTKNKNMLVPWFIMASYAYYENDRPILSDAAFDALCKDLESSFETIQHPHKGLIDEMAFNTGHYLKYPDRIKYAIAELEKEVNPLDSLCDMD